MKRQKENQIYLNQIQPRERSGGRNIFEDNESEIFNQNVLGSKLGNHSKKGFTEVPHNNGEGFVTPNMNIFQNTQGKHQNRGLRSVRNNY